jgi:hypothetical protein
LHPGQDVDVRNRFDGRWVSGFEVATVDGTPGEEQVRLRRRSDGAVLPLAFSAAEVRARTRMPSGR